MALDRVNEGYIRIHYDLDKERDTVEYFNQVSTWSPSDYDGLTIKEVKKQVFSFFEELSEDDILDIDYYGYDGAYDINIKRKMIRPENDQEVIKRLMKKEWKKRKHQKALQDAADLLARNDTYGSGINGEAKG